jgi:hypothetical protein
MIVYWIGVFVALCINVAILFCVAKAKKKVTLSNAFIALIMSSISWAELGIAVLLGIVVLISEADNIVIWRSREKKE